MDTNILEDIGLTKAEIKTYIALLELGSSAAGHIIEKSGLQNSVVHRALNSLIEKGLINFIREGKRNVYKATDPDNFCTFIDDKKRRFEEILPELKQKQQKVRIPTEATVYKGIRGIDEVYHQLREERGAEYLSFGGGEQCEKRMGTAWWNNHHIKRIKNKLPSRQVFDETVRKFGDKLVARPISQVRYLPAEFAQFQETVIVGNLVAITIFTENPYSILIRDVSVAEGYKMHFELLWKLAKK
jgi:predicted transcriptional regulator